MSTPIVVGAIYAHPNLLGIPVLHRVIAVTDTHVVTRPVSGRRRLIDLVTRNHFEHLGCYSLVDANQEPSDLLAVAEAVGVVVVEVTIDEPVPYRMAGQQPAVEFSDGPTIYGPVLSDQRIAEFISGGETA